MSKDFHLCMEVIAVLEKIKVLFYTQLWANAGIESVIMSLLPNLDLDKAQILWHLRIFGISMTMRLGI